MSKNQPEVETICRECGGELVPKPDRNSEGGVYRWWRVCVKCYKRYLVNDDKTLTDDGYYVKGEYEGWEVSNK